MLNDPAVELTRRGLGHLHRLAAIVKPDLAIFLVGPLAFEGTRFLLGFANQDHPTFLIQLGRPGFRDLFFAIFFLELLDFQPFSRGKGFDLASIVLGHLIHRLRRGDRHLFLLTNKINQSA